MLNHDKAWGPGYDYLFLMYRKSGQASKAEAVLRQRYQNDPKSGVALVNLANFLLTTNRYDEAESVMKKAVSDKTAFPNGHQMLGDFYARARKYDQALDQFKQGAADDSKQALAYNQRIVQLDIAQAGQLASEGKRDEAVAKEQEALKLAQSLASKNPRIPPVKCTPPCSLQSGSPADAKSAVPELTKLVENIPNNPVLHVDLSRAYLAAADITKALNEATEAVQEEGKSRTRARPSSCRPASLPLASMSFVGSTPRLSTKANRH